LENAGLLLIVEGDFLRAREPTNLMPWKKPTYPSKAVATAYCFTLPAYSFAESPAYAPKEWKHWVDEVATIRMRGMRCRLLSLFHLWDSRLQKVVG